MDRYKQVLYVCVNAAGIYNALCMHGVISHACSHVCKIMYLSKTLIFFLAVTDSSNNFSLSSMFQKSSQLTFVSHGLEDEKQTWFTF